MLKWLFAVIIPAAIGVGVVAWYVTSGDGRLPWQAAQVEKPSKPAPNNAPTLSPNQRPQPESRGPGWALNCRSGAQEKTLNCRLSQKVVMKGSGRLLTQMTVLLPAGQQGARLNIQLPLGVSVAGGASVRVDENPAQSFYITMCDRGGCYAEAAMSPNFLTQLRTGSSLKVTFKNLADKAIELPLSLEGFEEAYTKAKSV